MYVDVVNTIRNNYRLESWTAIAHWLDHSTIQLQCHSKQVKRLALLANWCSWTVHFFFFCRENIFYFQVFKIVACLEAEISMYCHCKFSPVLMHYNLKWICGENIYIGNSYCDLWKVYPTTNRLPIPDYSFMLLWFCFFSFIPIKQGELNLYITESVFKINSYLGDKSCLVFNLYKFHSIKQGKIE